MRLSRKPIWPVRFLPSMTKCWQTVPSSIWDKVCKEQSLTWTSPPADSREKAQASMSAVKRPSTVVARWFWLTEYRWTRTWSIRKMWQAYLYWRMQLLPLSMEPVPLMVLSLSQPRAAARICLHKCHSMHLSHSTARQPVRNIWIPWNMRTGWTPQTIRPAAVTCSVRRKWSI